MPPIEASGSLGRASGVRQPAGHAKERGTCSQATPPPCTTQYHHPLQQQDTDLDPPPFHLITLNKSLYFNNNNFFSPGPMGLSGCGGLPFTIFSGPLLWGITPPPHTESADPQGITPQGWASAQEGRQGALGKDWSATNRSMRATGLGQWGQAAKRPCKGKGAPVAQAPPPPTVQHNATTPSRSMTCSRTPPPPVLHHITYRT